MKPTVMVPATARPHLMQCWRAVHDDPAQQAFVVQGVWGVHLYRYTADARIAGHDLLIRPGWAGFTPPNVEAEYRFRGHSVHMFAHFEWPKQDDSMVEVPLLFPVGSDFAILWERMEEVSTLIYTDWLRAEVKLWDLILTLIEATRKSDSSVGLPTAVSRALATIDQRLGEPVSVEEIAGEACVSPNHLARLFRAHLGTTVIGTIQERRVVRARHLLERSDIPIKEVAVQVGIPDLQHFNKTIRRHLGSSPSQVRALSR